MTEKTTYNFGEKNSEKIKNRESNKWEDFKVWQSPKYEQSKKKAIELINSGTYGLVEADFWILMNKGGDKMVYSGLIISHDGCLKINDKLDDKLKFEPESAAIYKDEGGKNIVMRYVNSSQGIYEFGEISPINCKNEYPYAMVLKRLFDRVVLRTSKIGFFGIHSVSESDSFKEKFNEEEGDGKEDSGHKKLGKALNGAMTEIQQDEHQKQFARIKDLIESVGSMEELQGVWGDKENQKKILAMEKYSPALYQMLFEAKEKMKKDLGENE